MEITQAMFSDRKRIKQNSRRISEKSVLKASHTLLNNLEIKQNSQRKKRTYFELIENENTT